MRTPEMIDLENKLDQLQAEYNAATAAGDLCECTLIRYRQIAVLRELSAMARELLRAQRDLFNLSDN